MNAVGSTQVDWRLRAPRPSQAESAGRDATLRTPAPVAIDRDRVSPDSCAEGRGLGSPAGWRLRSYAARMQHSSPATGLRNRREATCFRAFSGPTGASPARSDAAAWRHRYQEAAQERPAKSPCFQGLDGNRVKKLPELCREGNLIQC